MEWNDLKNRILILLMLAVFTFGSGTVHATRVSAQQPAPPWRFELPWKTETSEMTVGDQRTRCRSGRHESVAHARSQLPGRSGAGNGHALCV